MQRLLQDHLRNPAPTAATLGDDMLYGVDAIRAFLNLRNNKQVYNMRDAGEAPIILIPAIGIAASKTALNDYFKSLAADTKTRAAKLADRKKYR